MVESWFGIWVGHHGFYFRLYVFELGQFELMIFHFLLLIDLFVRLIGDVHFDWGLLVALLQHVGHGISLFL